MRRDSKAATTLLAMVCSTILAVPLALAYTAWADGVAISWSGFLHNLWLVEMGLPSTILAVSIIEALARYFRPWRGLLRNAAVSGFGIIATCGLFYIAELTAYMSQRFAGVVDRKSVV